MSCQIFSQPALRPSLAYHPGQSINYNIGYNLGRTIGKSMDPLYNSFPALRKFILYWFSQAPSLGASLDRQPDASKVVLVLANDTPETSALPQPDPETLKRLVRTPDFWDQFASHMTSFSQQMTQQVPELSRTFGAGINEFISQTPILGDAQQTGAIDFANLSQSLGERLLPPNLFPTTSDSNSGNAEKESTPPPPPETERVENNLLSNIGNPLLENPLFRSFQSFAPQAFPTPPPLGNMFNAMPAWPWLGQNLDGSASDISEVRVRPGSENPYKISPKEGITQKMTEMKLRAAMKDALDKKTIPILWFSLPANNEKESTKDMPRPLTTSSPMSEEDKQMRMKLEAFEKQLISELKQLQEVVKLANAMKKAQLEAKGMKFGATDAISPLALNNTPIYKITLADIEKTLKDEYVRKLLQMIYNTRHKDMPMKEGNPDSTNMKYSTDLMGNPNKRQATTASEAMAHINKEDMLKMMAYAYRMAAANGLEVPWQADDNVKGLEDTTKGMSKEQLSAQRQWIDSQFRMQNQQQRMPMNADGENNMSEQENQRHGGHHTHHRPHHHGHHHGGHFPRQWLESDQQMQQLGNTGQMPVPMEATSQQRQSLDSNAQMKQQPFQQTMPHEQRQWLENNAQMNQQQFQQNMLEQLKQRQWLESNGHMMQQPFQQMMPQMRQQQQQPFQQTMSHQGEQRQWIEGNAQMKPQQQHFQQTMQHLAEQRQSLESNAQMKQQHFQQTMPQQSEQRQALETNTEMNQQPFQQTMSQQAEQRQWLESNGQMKQPSQLQSQMPMQMRQMMPMNTESEMPHQTSKDANDPNMQMRQWLDNTGQQTLTSGPVTESKTEMAMQQQRQMHSDQMRQHANPNEQLDPSMNMRQSAGPAETPTVNERQMSQNPQFQMNEQHQRQMTNSGTQPQAQMANRDSQSQTHDAFSTMQRQNGQQMADQMSKADERQVMANHDPGMQISNEATPQMPENAGKERHKGNLFGVFRHSFHMFNPDSFQHQRRAGLEDLLDDFDLFGHHDKKLKDKGKGTTVNYYYNAGGSRYPPIYASPAGGYGGYAPPPPPPSYGYARPPSYVGYARPPPPSGYYGGGGYGSNAYGSRGGYRTATGDEEIEEMLRQHQTLPVRIP